MEVVGEAREGASAVSEFLRLHPDIVLMDLQMPPGMGGIEATELMNETAPDAKVIIFSAYDSDFDVLRAVEAGARAFLLKNAPTGEVVDAILDVASGGSRLTPRAADRLLQQLRGGPDILTTREVEVLQLVTLGSTTSSIARQLRLSEGTVKVHLRNIFAKLGTNDRTSAVVAAYRKGIIRLDA